MRKIFVIGAGRSTASLIKYLLENASTENWEVTVGDLSLEWAKEKVNGYEHGRAILFDVNDAIQRVGEINRADLVISMLPASLHLSVAQDCIALGKHMVTASYVSKEMKELDAKAKEAGVILMNEVGLDPGIDHMSAMKVIDEIRDKGGEMQSFKSFTGGLVAPESDNNPWNYKFTWNPRNVVLAGQGGAAMFLQQGRYKFIPYHQLFRRTIKVEIEGSGRFEGYANRDSLGYREIYGLEGIPTIYRGTLRRQGFCKAWNALVRLGVTDDSYTMVDTESMTNREFINSFLAFNPHDTVEMKTMHYLGIERESVEMEKLIWLGIFDDVKIGLKDATPAQILQHILMKKWALDEGDKDMIAMWHQFVYSYKGETFTRESSMVFIGEEQPYTAMAKTVGLPVAMATKLILNGTISSPGVCLPIQREVYEPMLQELKGFGIIFREREVETEL